MWKLISSVTSSLLQCQIHEIQPHRTTMILRRRWPTFLTPVGAKRRRPLKAKDYVYDLVEDTNRRRHKDMELVLVKYVDGLGKAGDVVRVRPHTAYNHLLLPKLAVYPTEDNLAKYTQDTTDLTHSSKSAQRTVNILAHRLVPLMMNKDEPWTLEPWHIRVALRKAGVSVPEDAITMPEKTISGPSMDLQFKEVPIKITINNLETVNVRFRFHLWSTDIANRLPHCDQHWLLPAEPLFPEDKPILDAMPTIYIQKTGSSGSFKS